jgi:hypothetical protein
MSTDITKLRPRRSRTRVRGRVSWQTELDDFTGSLVRVRMLRAMDRDAAHYPVFRSVSATIRRGMDEVMDDLALRGGRVAQRPSATHLLLDDGDVFVSVHGRKVPVGSSLTFEIWAGTLSRLESVRDRLLAVGGEYVRRRDMFTIDWRFSGGYGLTGVAFDEAAEPTLMPEAYPSVGEPIEHYVERFLAARETVLVVLGPPGTGKTRLVRSILTAMSRRKEDSARVLYTADQKAVEGDEIFVDFITGSHDAFVVEDADHLLRARANGNTDLHRFLAIADGVVRAQGRKIIFTTNLPNISDVDEALVRPGRAFGVLRTRLHTREEALRLAGVLLNGKFNRDEWEVKLAGFPRGVSLAEIYRMAGA